MTMTSTDQDLLAVDALLARADDQAGPASAPAGREGAEAGLRQALARLSAALTTEAALTGSGARVAAGAIVAAITTARRLRRFAAERPELPRRPLPPVVVITGLHRTGSTLLHHLLAEHPRLRAPQLWELMHPVGGQDADGTAALVARTRSYVDEYYRSAPEFRTIHPLDAGRPEECHRLTGLTLRSEIYALRYRVPSYLDWLDRQDHHPAYGTHRLGLQAILWRRPGGHSVVLKCPFHLWHPAELAAAYPAARVIRLHRDPVATIASVSSLTRVIRQARAVRVDPAEIGAFWLHRTAAVTDRLLEDADGGSALPVLDVPYPRLSLDPLAVARDVCEFIGVPLTAPAELRMRRYLRATAPGERGVHRYQPEDFGLRTADLTRRFAAYRARFHA
jgi:hypothetical protein